MSDNREWLNMQADMFAARRRAEEAVKSANSWRGEAKRLERESDALREITIDGLEPTEKVARLQDQIDVLERERDALKFQVEHLEACVIIHDRNRKALKAQVARLTGREVELRIQALGAAISRRDWNAVEQAHATIRDALEAKP